MRIVIGPTCSGKSTLISQLKQKDQSLVIQYGVSFESNLPCAETIVHYNLLHYWTQESENKDINMFLDEPIFKTIFNRPHEISEVIVLVCPILDLIKRASLRTLDEDNMAYRYSRKFWSNAIDKTNFFLLYEILWEYLLNIKCKLSYFYSGGQKGSKFTRTDPVYVWKNLAGSHIKLPKHKVVSLVAQDSRMHYQSVILPYNIANNRGNFDHLITTRSASYKMFTQAILESHSLLDVGSAIGELAFYAERLGCSRVEGIELNKDRYEAAQLTKKVLASRVKFHKTSLQSFLSRNMYDCVTCLNVIHHVKDFESFLEKLCFKTKRYLVLEFPTLLDKKFMGINDIQLSNEINLLPLIGVSSIKKADQTFVYSPVAIEMMVKNIDPGLEVVEKFASPIKNRQIVIFKR